MNHNPKAYFLFDPKGNYVNAMVLYKALQKQINTKYYGAEKKNKTKSNLAEDLKEEETKATSFKGTQFADCHLPHDIFHLNRKIKNTVNQFTSRIGFLMLRDGSFEVQDSTGSKKPELPFAKEVVTSLSNEFGFASKFTKPDYFVPISVIEGMASSVRLQKHGIQIHCL